MELQQTVRLVLVAPADSGPKDWIRFADNARRNVKSYFGQLSFGDTVFRSAIMEAGMNISEIRSLRLEEPLSDIEIPWDHRACIIDANLHVGIGRYLC